MVIADNIIHWLRNSQQIRRRSLVGNLQEDFASHGIVQVQYIN